VRFNISIAAAIAVIEGPAGRPDIVGDLRQGVMPPAVESPRCHIGSEPRLSSAAGRTLRPNVWSMHRFSQQTLDEP